MFTSRLNEEGGLFGYILARKLVGVIFACFLHIQLFEGTRRVGPPTIASDGRAHFLIEIVSFRYDRAELLFVDSIIRISIVALTPTALLRTGGGSSIQDGAFIPPTPT